MARAKTPKNSAKGTSTHGDCRRACRFSSAPNTPITGPLEGFAAPLSNRKAREMLEFTNGTIDHIAWTVGYQDPATFRSLFKKITGLAPSEYRNRFGVSPSAANRGQ